MPSSSGLWARRPTAAIRSYLNDNKVPQLFVASGDSMFGDPQHYPWTIGFYPNYRSEARNYARHILKTKPDAKIAVLYQKPAFGDYLVGLRDGLGADHAAMIVKEVSYEFSEPTVNSQVVTLQAAGRRHAHHRRDAQIRGAGDPQGV